MRSTRRSRCAGARPGGKSSARRRAAIRRAIRHARRADAYVLHLGHWYAQSHPTEDFAETFAVWLPPRSRWRSQYAGWPAMAQARVRGRDDARARRTRAREVAVATWSSRSRKHAARCASIIGASSGATRSTRRWPTIGGCCACSGRRDIRAAVAASRFLREVRPQLRRLLVRRARMHPYLVNHVLRTRSIARSELDLRLEAASAKRSARRSRCSSGSCSTCCCATGRISLYEEPQRVLRARA